MPPTLRAAQPTSHAGLVLEMLTGLLITIAVAILLVEAIIRVGILQGNISFPVFPID